MGFFSKFEGKMEDTFEGAAGKMQKSPISPVQIMKKAEKQMRREKVVSAGKQYAPTLYTVLVNPDDDQRLFGFYPTLAGECETRLAATASADGLAMDGHPLVRFIVDDGLKHGKFDIIAEVVSAPIVEQLRAEEMQRYGMGGAKPAPVPQAAAYGNPTYAQQRSAQPQPMQVPPIQQPQAANPFTPNAGGDYGQQIFGEGIPAAQPVQPQPAAKPPLPYVPENEIDYSLNYGEYTFDSKNFEDYRKADESDQEQAAAAPNVTGEEKADSSPDAPQDEGIHGAASNANAALDVEAETPRQQNPHRPEHAAIPQPEYPAQQYGYAPQGMGAYPAPNPAYPPMGMGMQPGNAYAYAQQGQPYGAYPDMHQQAAPAPAPAYGAAPHTVAFTAGAAQANAVPHAGAVRAHLIDIASNRSYDLATSRILIGRETSNDIILNDLNVSRQHAQIAFEPQGVWVVTDLGSTNGTLVNGMPITRRGLADGDRITLGMTEFVFSMR